MDIQARKMHMIQAIIQLENEAFLDKIEALFQQEKKEHYEQRLKPMSKTQYINRAKKALLSIAEGKYMDIEEYAKQIENKD